MKQVPTIILSVYVIVYICLTIYNKPNYEFFNAFTTLGSSSVITPKYKITKKFGITSNNNNGNNSNNSKELSNDTTGAIDKDSIRFKKQEGDQNIQNREISSLKKRVDALRNDIVIMKNKEKEENRSIQNSIDMDDSISQLPDSVRDRFGFPNEIDFNFTIDPTL
jgi:uncharacterized protein YxeA